MCEINTDDGDDDVCEINTDGDDDVCEINTDDDDDDVCVR